MNPASRGKKCPVPLLLTVAIVRLVFTFAIWQASGSEAFVSPDTTNYVESAQSLLHGSFSHLGIPDIFRTPGYPLLLLPGVALGHPLLIGLLENVMLACASAWLIWTVVTKVYSDRKAGFWAVILYCFEPIGLVYSDKVLSETLFSTCLLLFVLCWIRFLDHTTYPRLAAAAIVLGASAYVRPVVLYLGILVIPLLLLVSPPANWPRRIRRAVLFSLIFGSVLAPWVIRNAVVADYRTFSYSADWNLYFLSAAAVESKLEHKTLAQIQKEWGNVYPEQYFRVHPEQRTWSQGRIARFWGSEARVIIRPHLLMYSAIHARGCLIVLFEPGATDILKLFQLYPESGGLLSRTLDQGFLQATVWLVRQYPAATLALGLLGLQLLSYYLLAISGLRRMSFQLVLFFGTLVLYFIAVSGVPAAVARYRAPIMPIVCLCAGIGITRLTRVGDAAMNDRPTDRVKEERTRRRANGDLTT